MIDRTWSYLAIILLCARILLNFFMKMLKWNCDFTVDYNVDELYGF